MILRRWVAHPWFPLLRLGTVIAAWVLWAWRPSQGWSLVLAAVPWAIAIAAGQRPSGPFVVNLAMALFLLSAGVGLWASYDPLALRAVFSHPVGWQKLWGLLLATMLYYALVDSAPARRWMLGTLVGFGAAVAVVSVVTRDWRAEPAKWELVTRLGSLIQSALPSLPGDILNPNVSAGILAPLLPLSLGLVGETRVRGLPSVWAAWGWATGAAILLGVLFATSRGAWMGLGASALLACSWWVRARWRPGRASPWAWGAIALTTGLAGGSIIGTLSPLGAASTASQAVANRLGIFSQALLLVRDYRFTGCGLGQFPLVHSTYAMLIHVPSLSHAHALLLDVAVEQGTLGAVAVIAAWGAGALLGLRELVRSQAPKPILAAGLTSLVTLAIHSTVDDALYSSRGVLLLWMPLATIVSALPADGPRRVPLRERPIVELAPLVAVAFGAGLALLLAGRALTAAWYANLGAVAQTKAELRAYDYAHFGERTLDQVRQQIDLSPAEARFARALALDPGQVTARARSSTIAASRGQYEQALLHAQAAWSSGHSDQVTRLLLGDALVATGQVENAAQVVSGLRWAADRLAGQAWYRYWMAEDYRRAADAWRAVALLDPTSPDPAHWIAEAEKRVATP